MMSDFAMNNIQDSIKRTSKKTQCNPLDGDAVQCRWRQHGPLEFLIPYHSTVRRHSPEDPDLKHYRRESLKTNALCEANLTIDVITLHTDVPMYFVKYLLYKKVFNMKLIGLTTIYFSLMYHFYLHDELLLEKLMKYGRFFIGSIRSKIKFTRRVSLYTRETKFN